MKKFMTLLLAAGMAFSAANASAADLKVSGSWDNTFQFTDNMYRANALQDTDAEEGHFAAFTRLRLNMDFVASEALSGRMQIQAGKYQYGGEDNAVGDGGSKLTARLLYVDWMVPNTDVQVRMGRQEVTLPSYTFGSPVLDDNIDGVTVSAPINDMVAVNFGWMRPASDGEGWDKAHVSHNDFDLAFLGVDVTADGFAVTPWFMAGRLGSNQSWVADEDGNFGYSSYAKAFGGIVSPAAKVEDSYMLYWAGLGAELTMFDPFKFTADFIYSANDADESVERKGWYAALGAEMATSFATPFLRGWYASGDDADVTDGSEAFFDAISGAFDASNLYFDGTGLIAATIDRTNPTGTWGLQLGLKDLSFVEGLTHELAVTYTQGTNNVEALKTLNKKTDVTYLTTSDSLVELSALTSYELYKNLSANLLLAYMITDFDEELRGQDFNNGFRGALNFNYKF